MIQTHHFKTYLIIIASCMLWAVSAHAEVNSRMSSRFLSRGERALLQVAIIGKLPTDVPVIPSVKGIEIKPTGMGPQTRLLPGRRLEHIFEYMVSSYEVGKHRLPAIEVNANGTTQLTEPLEFEIFNPDELQWQTTAAGDTQFRYASTFRVLDDQPYVGESIPVEIKVYVPRDLFVIDWGIPDFERDGVTAWRFEPSEMRGQANLLGMPYVSIAYPSTLTPTTTGEIGIGPAKIRLITTQVVMDGILRRISIETHLKIPKLTLQSPPLPDGAPDGFENAIGDFELQVTTPETEVIEGDPIPIEIIVTGSGNLNTLRPPAPVESDGWKLYDASIQERGDERRKLAGTTVFRQFMRPLELKSAIPTFQLVYFDPTTESYKTIKSEPISLNMIPTPRTTTQPSGPPPSIATPVEEMTDILGLIPNPSFVDHVSPFSSKWLLHGIGALLALSLIIRAIWIRIGHLFHRDLKKSQREKELREIEKNTPSDHDFLMAAGRYAERWHGNKMNEDIQEILKERDDHCFRPDDNTAPPLPSGRRKSILQTLRKASLILILGLLASLSTQTQANETEDSARDAYQSARYTEAVTIWLDSKPYAELSSDTLYHIGNACYRAGSSGYAALYYRRALARDPSHDESRQNLRFIERKYGALTIKRPDYQYAITQVPLKIWKQLTYAGIWLFVLGWLVFPATRRGARIRVIAIVAVLCGPMLSVCTGLGWYHFPRDTEFTPLAQQAVIVAEDQVLFTDASRTSTAIIEAPIGSLCEVIHQSGRWAYISFASKTHGWIPLESIEKVIPDTPPTTPKIDKPKVEDNNA